MKIRIEWSYLVLKTKQSFFMKSEFMSVAHALMLHDDLEKTGRLKSIDFYDEQDTTWTKKELLKFLKQFETEPHDVKAYIDGGFEKETKNSGVGLAIYYKQNHKNWRLRFNDTLELLEDNNEAEYAALYLLLRQLEELGVHHQTIQVYSDSMVVVNQASGEWPCYEEHYLAWLERIDQLTAKLGLTINYELIDRSLNKEADQLATQALVGTKIEATIEKQA
ncbi:conserved domain protein [Halalkalibacter akibai JCM 9157]|uniref:Conserved domain protein n=1 Tax=Halalkalibacter akibai (strain ATCC 43226 / DSM 21942 / CIP 109018 / JCM 9157 / 1139) TaxID=1236973 RepID=W4QU98_HALA3|nr:reverse transcriptase-like protein [Halalkalibacter akibai]GAE35745.1 conserved domain protein [Halalkalibacter akibai JCM 9157]